MSNSLVFKKLVNKNIFSDEFKDFNENNELLFPDKGICVLYGPNGTGKTSFVNILNNMDKTEYHAIYNGEEYTSSVSNNLFFIINDQNNRNIIKGETQDFLLGDNIRREYLLKHELEESYNKIVNELISTFKTNFNLSSKTSKLMNFIEPNIKNFVASNEIFAQLQTLYPENPFTNLGKKEIVEIKKEEPKDDSDEDDEE